MSKLNDLIARIKADVSIRKSKAGNVILDSHKIRALAAKSAEEKDPALRALIRGANAKAKKLLEESKDPYVGWAETGTVSLVQAQICRSCGESPVHIVGEFLELSGYAPRGDGIPPLRTQALVRRPAVRGDLPNKVQHLAAESVALCPHCLEGEDRVDIIIDALTKKPMRQLRLFS